MVVSIGTPGATALLNSLESKGAEDLTADNLQLFCKSLLGVEAYYESGEWWLEFPTHDELVAWELTWM